MKVLIVEDDLLIGDATQRALKQEGFSADWVQKSRDALLASTLHTYDAVVLDIGLPDGSGLDVLEELRKAKITTPVLMLTALNSIQDRVRGLNLGADDYLSKPFDVEELVARLRALHRRGPTATPAKLSVGDIELDPATHTTRNAGQVVDLGAKEFAILQTLFERVGRVVTKQELEENLYGWGEEVSSNAVEVLVHRIRKKLFSGLITTVRGVGYVTQATATRDDRKVQT